MAIELVRDSTEENLRRGLGVEARAVPRAVRGAEKIGWCWVSG